MGNDILIFAEQRENKIHPAAVQCVTPAKELAGKTGGKVIACVIGDTIDAAVDAMDKAGVDAIVTVKDAALANYSALSYRTALAAAIDKTQPKVVLLAATFMGRDLAPRVAAKVGGACATDVVGLDIADGALDVQRPVYNGKAFCRMKFPADRVAIASVRPNTFAAPDATGGGAAAEDIAFSAGAGDERIKVKEVAKTGGEVKDVTEADIIVAGGRSLKSEENFKIVFELANVLDAAVGASRAACDAGYQPHSRQVGLTGKTVTPMLYIACGISGAIQHLAGMRGSKVIVAVNTDKEAPIFKIADYGIVGDLFKVVPAMTAEVQRLKG
jgi:electron transfer flavoprotein alpha subunit